MPLRRATKAFSLTLIGMAIVCSVINGVRAVTLFNNPVGLSLNVMIIIFLIGGTIFIVRDDLTKR